MPDPFVVLKCHFASELSFPSANIQLDTFTKTLYLRQNSMFQSRKLHEYFLNSYNSVDLKTADLEHSLFASHWYLRVEKGNIIPTFSDPSQDLSVFCG